MEIRTISRTIRLGSHGLASMIAHLNNEIERWNINFSTRKQLLEMDQQQLRDIGIDSVEAEREGRKPFWRR